MADQSAGPAVSVRTPSLGMSATPFTPLSPLPSMDVLMQSPGMLYSSPGQDGKAPNDDAPTVQNKLPKEVTFAKLEQAELLISNVRKGAEDLIAALQETAKMTSAPAGDPSDDVTGGYRKRALSGADSGTAVKQPRLASTEGAGLAEAADVSTADDAEVTPVSLVISRVEAALVELAGLGKELTEAGVSFLPSSVGGARVEPDGEFAARQWDELVAERKAKDELDGVQVALRRAYLQLRQRYEEDRETLWEIDKVMKDLSATDPDRVSEVLRLLKENGVLEGGERAPGGSLVEQLERVRNLTGGMEMELVGATGRVFWSSSEAGSSGKVLADGEGTEGETQERPVSLRCLIPGVLRATLGVCHKGQLTTVSVTGAAQV